MYTVYVLQSDKRSIYVGLTDNIEYRLQQHRTGQSRASAGLCVDPSKLRLVHTWTGLTLEEASKLERWAQQRRFMLFKLIKQFPKVTPGFKLEWQDKALGRNYDFMLKNKLEKGAAVEAAKERGLDKLLDDEF